MCHYRSRVAVGQVATRLVIIFATVRISIGERTTCIRQQFARHAKTLVR